VSERFFVSCPRGLEGVLAQELASLGVERPEPASGGVGFAGEFALGAWLNLTSRIATRVLWQVGEGGYRNEDELYRLARDIPWPRHFAVERTIRVDVRAQRSPLRSLEFAALRVKDAVCDRFRAQLGARPSVDTVAPQVRLWVFLQERRARIYLDLSGEPLYRRGFKRSTVAAPLKENLAAGILILTGWRPDELLVDPMCGSGTFLLEAAMAARGIAPGLARGFALENLENFDPAQWRALRRRAEALRRDLPLRLWGSDVDPAMVAAARDNLAAAGLEEEVHWQVAEVGELVAPAQEGVLVANPPYGVRLDERERLAVWYPRLGDALKRHWAGWRAWILTADPELPRRLGLKASRRVPLFNGALECRLLEYRLVAGPMRRRASSTPP
jgi:putative N6-adenine-specific DNA methylase